MLTFLKKLGQILAKGLAIVADVGPIAIPFLGSGKAASTVTTAVNDFTSIGQVVLQAEALIQGTGTGADKLNAATPLVASIVQTSELVSGKKIANASLFTQGCQKITSGMADILNSIHPDSANGTGTAVTGNPAPAGTAAPTPTPAS